MRLCSLMAVSCFILRLSFAVGLAVGAGVVIVVGFHGLCGFSVAFVIIFRNFSFICCVQLYSGFNKI
jgi:hypothetical protein